MEASRQLLASCHAETLFRGAVRTIPAQRIGSRRQICSTTTNDSGLADALHSLRPQTTMNSLRIARAALRARPAALRAPLQRRGYAEAVSDKVRFSPPHCARRKTSSDPTLVNRSSSACRCPTRYAFAPRASPGCRRRSGFDMAPGHESSAWETPLVGGADCLFPHLVHLQVARCRPGQHPRRVG